MKTKVKINKAALNDAILDAMKEATKGKLFDILCPHCSSEVSVPEGKSSCPACGKEIDLTLNYKLD